MSFIQKIKNFYDEVKKREYKNKLKELANKYEGKKEDNDDCFFKFFKDKEYRQKLFKDLREMYKDKVEVYLVIKELISTIVFVIVAVILIREFIGELRIIPSASMKNTIIEGDRVFVQKLTSWNRSIQRGDVIVFYPPSESLLNDFWSVFTRLTGIFCKDIAYIKRVVAIGGDKFEIKEELNGNSYVYVNDVKLEEPYILTHKDWISCKEGMYCGPFIIPEDSYFMMGDNRGNSLDSRFWGVLNKDRVIGRATFLFWPLNRIKKL